VKTGATSELAETSAHQRLNAGDHVLSVTCLPQADGVEFALSCDGQDIGRSTKRIAMPLAFQHGGTRFRIGEDDGFPVLDSYEPPFAWKGRIRHVVVDASGPPPRPPQVDVIDALRAE
jgi:hypothetical protein